MEEEHNATPPEGSASSAVAVRPITAGRHIVRRPRGRAEATKELYDEEEPQYCDCAPDGLEQFIFPKGSRFCAMCGENRPTLEEIQQKFMGDAAADEVNDRLRLFVLRREYVIELAKKAMDAKAEGIEPDPLPVFQVS